MKIQMHLAAQYLAAAGISFLTKKDDDSHTNLGWSIEKQQLETHPLSSKGDILSLNYNTFSLEWNVSNNNASFLLDGKTHQQVLQWLEETSRLFLNKAYTYDFHYNLPYSIDATYTFKLNVPELKYLAALRTLAQSSVVKTLNTTDLESSIRVWPHHFDLGAYASLAHKVSVGFGLAIPDDIINEHYFYISGYGEQGSLDTNNFEILSLGEWKNTSFKGAVLPVANVNEKEVLQFFAEAIGSYTKTTGA
ncbi:hypothetical protein [Maribacter ulvicola]|uniref:Uncharacterized protein n=1 Tax=Maribacter ulvicola TaxID=228959 RepID=A0A1N7A3S2_9FLAO|nr:hypothetical protein [Maribacter ulvicola]SIR33641.1 hypothetical protein SAMN05421797_11091 [Maribacter ulvicola]